MGDNTRIYMRNDTTRTNTPTSNTILQNPNNSNYTNKMVSIWIPSRQRIIHKRQKKTDTTTFLTTHMVSNGIYKPKRNIFPNVPNSKSKRRNRRHVLLPKNNLLTRTKKNRMVKQKRQKNIQISNLDERIRIKNYRIFKKINLFFISINQPKNIISKTISRNITK